MTLYVIGGTSATYVKQTLDPPQCEGIGWGCTPDWTFRLTIFLVLAVIMPVLCIGAVAAIELSRWWWPPERRRRVQDVLAKAIVTLSVVMLLLLAVNTLRMELIGDWVGR